VFEKVSKPVNVLTDQIKDEAKQWSLASAGCLSLPTPKSLVLF
jgi:hypothetical protein